MIKKHWKAFRVSSAACLLGMVCILCALSFQGCGPEDPHPVNEEEVITTVEVSLAPEGGGTPVTLRFYDQDGENGSIEPVQTISGSLATATVYSAQIALLNETITPALNISDEVEEEGNDHLFCFSVSGDLSIEYDDEDSQGMPLGLSTRWLTGGEGQVQLTIILRHQAGTKTGDCPGLGETDLEVSFGLIVQ